MSVAAVICPGLAALVVHGGGHEAMQAHHRLYAGTGTGAHRVVRRRGSGLEDVGKSSSCDVGPSASAVTQY